MYTLGISAFYHDSAVALVGPDGIIAAAQEERFSRVKHDARFPRSALRFCLQEAGIAPEQIGAVVFYEKPFRTFERILESHLALAPRGFDGFALALPTWINQKMQLKAKILRELRDTCGVSFRGKIFFSEHHLSHAASAFFPSPFQEAAILTLDGVGEWSTASICHGHENGIKMLKQMRFPHSWGLFYSAVTAFLGFRVNSGEYKVMGLAPYGKTDGDRTREFEKKIREHLIDVNQDGSCRLKMQNFTFLTSDRMMDAKRWSRLFGLPVREPETRWESVHADFALAAQRVLEDGVIRMAREARRLTGSSRLVLAGGVALNCVANARIRDQKIFDEIWVQPAAGDAGGALGAALAYHYIARKARRLRLAPGQDMMRGCSLGPAFGDQEIASVLSENGLGARPMAFSDLCEKSAELLSQDQVLGWFQGKMEWGPRALGQRSILAAARHPDMQKRLNVKIKFRESFRPFAPAVLKEEATDYFAVNGASPYMLFTAPITRQGFPAVTHVDGSARLQTVDRDDHPEFWQLLRAYRDRSGFAILCNTSFNVRGEPLVCSPKDAFRCFVMTDMDALAMGSFLLEKTQIERQQPGLLANLREKFRDEVQFAAD